MHRARPLLIAAASAGAIVLVPVPVARASGATVCTFGGPTPGFGVAQVSLPYGASYLNLQLTGSRTGRVVDTSSDWHLAQGVFVIDARTRRLVAYRVSDNGAAAQRWVVRANGVTAVDTAAPGPDAPFVHTAGPAVDGLPAGRYLIVAFGSAGGAGSENWGAQVQLSAGGHCAVGGHGVVFDRNLAEFRGGREITTPAGTVAQDAALTMRAPPALVVGFVDSATQLAGSARTSYRTPTGAGSATEQIVPFVSTAGRYAFRADVAGPFATVDIAGAAVTLP